MKQNRQAVSWIVDAVLFGGFLGALWLDLTGVAAHQWLGLAVAVLAGYHLAAHRRWVAAVTGRFFGRTGRQSRTFYAVDAGLAIGFAAILITGVTISTWLGTSLVGYASWRAAHVAASVATLALIVAKIGLHWRWIVQVTRRHVLAPAGVPGRQQAGGALGRLDFVRLMAGVGTLSVLAGWSALSGAGSGEPGTPAGQATQAASSAASAPTTCFVRCNRRCSFPGHCRRYTDANNNNRCDLGECLS